MNLVMVPGSKDMGMDREKEMVDKRLDAAFEDISTYRDSRFHLDIRL